jgi:hypothetical protein
VPRVEPLYSKDGALCWREHPSRGKSMDVVALPLSRLDDVALYPYVLAEQPKIACRPADSLSVVGFPFGLHAGGSLAVWATGFLASEPDVDFTGLPLLLVDCRTRQGQSGSAVIAFRSSGAVAMEDGSTAFMDGPVWRLLGVYSGRVNVESDLGLVWKLSALEEVVASVT